MLIFLDIETTGYRQEDKICSLGMIVFNDALCVASLYEIVNEGKKIPAVASSLHNITNEMIQERAPLRESKIFDALCRYNQEENRLVVHNGAFLFPFLKNADFWWQGKVIDTQKVLKHSILDSESFRLEFMRYELKLYQKESEYKKMCGIKDALVSHHALSDALVIKMLFDYLAEEFSQEEMEELSFKNVLLEKFSFGKYAGRYIEEIAMSDRAYLMWMLSLEHLDDDLRYSIEYYLQG